MQQNELSDQLSEIVASLIDMRIVLTVFTLFAAWTTV